MTENPRKPRVFLSYSRDPSEDVQFAMDLAERLRFVGFEVWSDDESEGPGAARGSAAREAIESARHAVFIVTKAWLERPGSRAEIELASGHAAETRRRLAVRREPLDERPLATLLEGLPSVEWPPEDPEPDARFWEVYCGLTRTPPGNRRLWAESGRQLLAGRSPGPLEAAGEQETGSLSSLKCSSRPVLARSARDWTLVLTDSGACFKISRGAPHRLEPLPDLDGCSAVAVDKAGNLFVGLYDGMLATPRDGEWAYHSAQAPVLCLCASPWGLAIGDAAGNVVFREPPAPAVARALVSEPVVELRAFDDGLVALGARGAIWIIGPPQDGTVAVAPVAPNDAIGRPVGLFDTGSRSRAGVFSADRIAVIGRGARTLSVGIRRFPEGIQQVVPFGAGSAGSGDAPLGLLTDAGFLWVVESDLKRVAPILLPDTAGIATARACGAGRLDIRRRLGRGSARPDISDPCRGRRRAGLRRAGRAERSRPRALARGSRDPRECVSGPKPRGDSAVATLTLKLDELDWDAVADAALDRRQPTRFPPGVLADALESVRTLL